MQVAAVASGTLSVHPFALHAVPPVAHPQALPAPSVVALHKTNEFKLYVVQAASTAQVLPLKTHECR